MHPPPPDPLTPHTSSTVAKEESPLFMLCCGPRADKPKDSSPERRPLLREPADARGEGGGGGDTEAMHPRGTAPRTHHEGGHDDEDWNQAHVGGSLLLHLVEGRNFTSVIPQVQHLTTPVDTPLSTPADEPLEPGTQRPPKTKTPAGSPPRGQPVKTAIDPYTGAPPATAHGQYEDVQVRVTRRGDRALITSPKECGRRMAFDYKMEYTSPPRFDLSRGKLEIELVRTSTGEVVAKANVALVFLAHVAPGQTHTVDLLCVPRKPGAPPVKLPQETCPGVKFVIYPDFPSTSPLPSSAIRMMSAQASSVRRKREMSTYHLTGRTYDDDVDADLAGATDALHTTRTVRHHHRDGPASQALLPRSPVAVSEKGAGGFPPGYQPRAPPASSVVDFVDVRVHEGSGCHVSTEAEVPTRCKVQVTYRGVTHETPALSGPRPSWRGLLHGDERVRQRHGVVVRGGESAQVSAMRFDAAGAEDEKVSGRGGHAHFLDGSYAHIRLFGSERRHPHHHLQSPQGGSDDAYGPWKIIGTCDVELGHIAGYPGRELRELWIALDSKMKSRVVPKESSPAAGGGDEDRQRLDPHRRVSVQAAGGSVEADSEAGGEARPRADSGPQQYANTLQTAVSATSTAWLCVTVSLRSLDDDGERASAAAAARGLPGPTVASVRRGAMPPPPPLLKEVSQGGGLHPSYPATATPGYGAAAATPARPPLYSTPTPFAPISPMAFERGGEVWASQDASAGVAAAAAAAARGGSPAEGDDLGPSDSVSHASRPREQHRRAAVRGGPKGADGGLRRSASPHRARGHSSSGGGGAMLMQTGFPQRSISPPRLPPTWGVSTPSHVMMQYLESLGCDSKEARQVCYYCCLCTVFCRRPAISSPSRSQMCVVLARHGVKELAALLNLMAADVMRLQLPYASKKKLADCLP